jgi:hypothetical protein
LEYIHRADPVKLTLLRKQQLIEIVLRANSAAPAAAEKLP